MPLAKCGVTGFIPVVWLFQVAIDPVVVFYLVVNASKRLKGRLMDRILRLRGGLS